MMTMKGMWGRMLLLLCVVGLCSCANDLITGGRQYDCPGEGVFVCNEGNFMYGNASLSYYDPASKTVYNQVFYNANNFPLGDVCQSMAIVDGKGFVVVNNSGKVYVIDLNTFKYLGAISGLTSPRYIQVISEDKIYISDLYSPSMAVVDPRTYEITGRVYMGTTKGPGKVNGTEQMVRYGKYVYVCSWSYNDKVYKVDTETDKVVDSLSVTRQPNSMVLDKNGQTVGALRRGVRRLAVWAGSGDADPYRCAPVCGRGDLSLSRPAGISFGALHQCTGRQALLHQRQLGQWYGAQQRDLQHGRGGYRFAGPAAHCGGFPFVLCLGGQSLYRRVVRERCDRLFPARDGFPLYAAGRTDR